MPWHKVNGHSDCPDDRPWAVVKDEDGEVEGCHATEAEADAQLAALYASEEDDDDDASVDVMDAVLQRVYATEPLEEAVAQDRPIEAYSLGRYRGVLAVEDVKTGDGRMFAPGALVWRDLPLSLYWQVQTADGHDNAVITASMQHLWRDGNKIRVMGVFDMGGEYGREAHRLVHGGFMRGVSVTLDDVKDSDVEVVWPDVEEGAEDEDPMAMLFAEPELIIFHHGRIMDACQTGQPALQEAYLELVADDEPFDVPTGDGDAAASPNAVTAHATPTSDEAWDSSAHEGRLTASITLAVARSAYAWVNADDVKDDTLSKSSCWFMHHEVDSAGRPGPANLTACSSAIGVLNGVRGGTNIPESDRQAVYDHLAAHLRDAGQEPPELVSLGEAEAITASLAPPLAPPVAWFRNPRLDRPTPFTVTDDGRVFGHLASWGTCHTSFANTCVVPPRAPQGDYGYYRKGELKTREGDMVAVGQLTLGTGHAPASLRAAPAASHYDNTGHAIADIACGEDRFGIWMAGALRPDADEVVVRTLRASGVSGDWRKISGHWRLVGALVVNVPGYPIPRTRTYAHDGEQLSLVASGVVTHAVRRPVPISVVDRIARSIGRDASTRARELRARVHPQLGNM